MAFPTTVCPFHTPAQGLRLSSSTLTVARPVSTRGFNVGHLSRAKPCKAVLEPRREDQHQVSSRQSASVYAMQCCSALTYSPLQLCSKCYLCVQASEDKLSYEALEMAFKQERLDNLNRQRANQQLQAKAARAEAGAKKAVRVLTKGIRRCREHQSRVRLLETKIDRVARESDLLQLHQTIDEKEEDLQRAQEEAHIYKAKHWRSMVRHH